MANVMSKKVFIIGSACEATVTLRGHVSDKYGYDVEIVTVDQFNDIKQPVTHIVGCGTVAIALRPQPELPELPEIPEIPEIPELPELTQLPQIFVDKKRKGWKRPYKYHM